MPPKGRGLNIDLSVLVRIALCDPTASYGSLSKRSGVSLSRRLLRSSPRCRQGCLIRVRPLQPSKWTQPPLGMPTLTISAPRIGQVRLNDAPFFLLRSPRTAQQPRTETVRPRRQSAGVHLNGSTQRPVIPYPFFPRTWLPAWGRAHVEALWNSHLHQPDADRPFRLRQAYTRSTGDSGWPTP